MSFVRDQLDLVREDVKILFKGDHALVQCPFHKDGQETHPSLMVNLDNTRYPEGFCYCLSCGTKGDWNKLAEALDLEPISAGMARPDSFSVKKIAIKPPEIAKFYSSLDFAWNPSEDWRGIKGELLAAIKATKSFNSKTKDKGLTLPVQMLGETVGVISCSLAKRSKDQGPSYYNSPGPWVKRALFPFDYMVQKLSNCYKPLPLFLVEGPRDALNLLQHDAPALAILGCNNWSRDSLPLLSILNPSNYVILMDGDDAGRKAAENIYADLTKVLPKDKIKVCKLPEGKDPADLKQSAIEWLISTYSGNS